MMAEKVTVHFIDNNGWTEYDAYVYDISTDKPISTDHGWPGFHRDYTTETINKQKVVTWTIDLGSCTLANARIIFNNRNNGNGNQYPTSGGFNVENNQYYNNSGLTSAPTEGGGTESGGGGSTTVEWNTVTTNRLTENPRVYSQGFYLVGNFFTFDGNTINYDDAVFKFQQQSNDKDGNAVYKVEIPASLTAHAQVMSIDELGKFKKVYGPESVCRISKDSPAMDGMTVLSALTGSTDQKEGTNYWDIDSRNVDAANYTDGMYEVFITIDKTTGEPSKWQFKHTANKRVAFFISDEKSATAMPLYDTYKKNEVQFGDKFFATVNLSAQHSYYVISNYVMKNECVSKASQYGALKPDGNRVGCPTTNKLFLLGNGGYSIESTDETNQHNHFSPNEKPMKPSKDELGVQVVEYNCSNGDDTQAKLDKHFGIRGQVRIRDPKDRLTSVSLVGDAIPGTLKIDETTGKEVWDFTSNAADMTYDETEQCYKVTLVTNAAEGKKHFRFVGNHTQKINWYEDSKTDAKKKAKTPYTGDGDGHAATSYDPNKVNYTNNNANPESDWNIIWNRPAGRWTVRLYFYTYSDGNDPVTDYYYTISENRDLELRDFDDVVYKSLDNKRNILLRGGYKYFRTWSAKKAWKISKDVDIFVVNDMKSNTDGTVSFSLLKINADSTGKDNVIPSNTGVILATMKTADQIEGGAVLRERASLTSYNTMVLPMQEYNPTTASTSTDYSDTNYLKTMVEAGVVPTYNKTTNEYNYLFGFYHAITGTGNADNPATGKKYNADEYLLGFWISNGNGTFYNNSAYLPIPAAKVENMGLGVSYKDFDTTTHAKKVPALFFDFANIGDTTGIDEVVNTTVKNHDGKYYTLSGQQVEKPTTSGVYIHNGKKFVVR